jgi:hypothetical protein
MSDEASSWLVINWSIVMLITSISLNPMLAPKALIIRALNYTNTWNQSPPYSNNSISY